MSINLKLRLKNKATATALVAATVAFVYQILSLFGIAPTVSQSEIINLLGIVINLLVGLGILVDPTTEGVSDSTLSLQKDKPENAEATLLNNMPSDTLTSSDDAYADADISDEATKQIVKMEERNG